jgi:hypothetical protein
MGAKVMDEMNMKESFRRDLASLLNRYSLENGSNTPDFMLADYLIQCLLSLDQAINRRAQWHEQANAKDGTKR